MLNLLSGTGPGGQLFGSFFDLEPLFRKPLFKGLCGLLYHLDACLSFWAFED